MRTRSILWVDDSFYVAVLLCRRVAASPGCKTHWSVCANPSERNYITLLCSLNAASDGILTVHLFPRVNIEFRRSREDDPWLASGTRLEDLGEFYNPVKAIRKRAA